MQLGKFFRPLGIVPVERLGQATPAHIPGQDLLFLRGGQPAFRLDFPQGLDGGHIVVKFGLGPALAQVAVRDAEIAALFRGNFRVQHSGGNPRPARRGWSGEFFFLGGCFFLPYRGGQIDHGGALFHRFFLFYNQLANPVDFLHAV